MIAGSSQSGDTQEDQRDSDDPGPTSPCPEKEVTEAGFADRHRVPHVHGSNVDCVAWHDIVGGFPDGTFRPNASVRRDQMATFVAGTLAVAGVELPEEAQDFEDVRSTSSHSDAIERLTAAGIVSGGPATLDDGSYGPGRRVRRDQMASFMVRAVEYATGRELSSTDQAFKDVPEANVHFGNVNAAAENDLSRGLGREVYDPEGEVRRDQMATFAVRLLPELEGCEPLSGECETGPQ